MADDKKVIFSMSKLSKTYQEQINHLKYLFEFLYGAKLVYFGLNGSGKSSLLKIIAKQARKRTKTPTTCH
jgi:ATPase subunit of ABC transporter with duplicated ATPase domains